MKPKHFWEIYNEILTPMQNRSITLLELGIQKGESLKYWKMLLPAAKVIGVDIDKIEVEGAITLQMDQTDKRIAEYAPFDVVIDDGGHKMSQQKESFKILYPCVRNGGLYIIEDIETSYWGEFIDEEPTMIEYLKTLIESVNRESIENPRSVDINGEIPNHLIEYITFYKNLCLIKKPL